jgi:hypothetical protein
MQSFLGVPIVVRGEAFGNLYLAEKGASSVRRTKRRWLSLPIGRP